MKVRSYIGNAEMADGKDEGGYFRWIDVPDIPKKLVKRMIRCSGCHDDFYNHRINISGNHCFSLNVNKYFSSKIKPKCFHS